MNFRLHIVHSLLLVQHGSNGPCNNTHSNIQSLGSVSDVANGCTLLSIKNIHFK